MLELKPTRFLSTDYAATLHGAPLTVVTDTQGPLTGRFDCAGQRFVVGPAVDGGTGWGLVRAVVRGAIGRGAFALRRADQARPLAVAHGRGLRGRGFDLALDGATAALDVLAAGDALRWRSAQGEGQLARLGARGVSAHLPDTLAPELQVFAALLALSHWETVSTGA